MSAAPSDRDRRRLLAGLAAAALAPTRLTAETPALEVTLRDGGPRRPISALLYGDNDNGTMGGEPEPDAVYAARARVSLRRLGGNLTSTYNWTVNATNSGSDWLHTNDEPLVMFLGVPSADAERPAAVIETMHARAQAMGAATLITLPLSDFVAADKRGPVSEAEAAPSPRWTPVVWRDDTPAEAPVDRSVADIGHLLRRLVARHGPASGPTGVRAYALDNEPDLWFETHPRLWPRRIDADGLIARSIAAARVIRRVDPSARILGPASWGPTGYLDFHGAPGADPGPDGPPSFLARYLDAFARASDAEGVRLLDALDVHWYAQSRDGGLHDTVDPAHAALQLDAPRSLDEPGFLEASWLADIAPELASAGLGLPILPSLRATIERHLPGLDLAVTEFNFGGASAWATGLAVADALGRFGRAGVWTACHWGALAGYVGAAYRLYREPDAAGPGFGARSIEATIGPNAPPDLAVYAADDAGAGAPIRLVLLNKAETPRAIRIRLASGAAPDGLATIGFDAAAPDLRALAPPTRAPDGALHALLPPRSAQRVTLV